MKRHAIKNDKDKVNRGRNVVRRRTDDRAALTGCCPVSPLHLTCTFLSNRLCITKLCGPVPIGRLGRGFVDALLHPLHDQVQQR